MGEVGAVKAGEIIKIKYPFNPTIEEVVIKPACDDKTGGQWYCATHECWPENQFMKNSHIQEPGMHRLVWICHKHGAEEP